MVANYSAYHIITLSFGCCNERKQKIIKQAYEQGVNHRRRSHGKVLIIVGEATETVDTLYPYLRLQEDDFEPVVAGPEKRLYHMVLHEIPILPFEMLTQKSI